MSRLEQFRCNGRCLMLDVVHWHWRKAWFHLAGVRRAVFGRQPCGARSQRF